MNASSSVTLLKAHADTSGNLHAIARNSHTYVCCYLKRECFSHLGACLRVPFAAACHVIAVPRGRCDPAEPGLLARL
jgi:hypothetical protein